MVRLRYLQTQKTIHSVSKVYMDDQDLLDRVEEEHVRKLRHKLRERTLELIEAL